jgi:hypothetical protein
MLDNLKVLVSVSTMYSSLLLLVPTRSGRFPAVDSQQPDRGGSKSPALAASIEFLILSDDSDKDAICGHAKAFGRTGAHIVGVGRLRRRGPFFSVRV